MLVSAFMLVVAGLLFRLLLAVPVLQGLWVMVALPMLLLAPRLVPLWRAHQVLWMDALWGLTLLESRR